MSLVEAIAAYPINKLSAFQRTLQSISWQAYETFFPPLQYTQCLQELKELLQQEIHKKFSNFGQDVDLEASWSDIPLSDIESR